MAPADLFVPRGTRVLVGFYHILLLEIKGHNLAFLHVCKSYLSWHTAESSATLVTLDCAFVFHQ